ncbi:putative trans-sialidase [Trypanosoma cruzi]|nr:putative trans-sialidase [Trypanosoma cruzi]
MSRRVFTSAVLLLLVVLMCCSSGGAVHAAENVGDPNYKWKDIKSEGEGVTVDSLGVPGLLKVGSDVFAVAEAQCKKGGDTVFTGIASQLLTMETGKEKEEVLKEAKVKTQVLEEVTSSEGKKVDVSRPTTVVQGSNIYMLVGKYSRKDGQESGAGDWGLLLARGDVSEEEHKKKIYWKSTESLPRGIFGTQPESLTGLIGGGGSGVKMNDGTIVFPVEATKTMKEGTGKDGKTVSLILYSSETKNWTLSKGMSADGCSDPSVVEWKDDKLMMMTACDDGRRRVYESGDKGESWTEALGTLSRVWGSKQKRHEKGARSGFSTATLGDGVEDKRNVMLVTLPVYSKEEGNGEKGVLHLLLTDNTHIAYIGPVSEEDEEEITASSLLYKSGDNNEEELIALYEKKKGGGESSPGMVSVLLTAQLKRVKDVLATWKEVDERVSKLCLTSRAAVSVLTENDCKNIKITEGLVGFLSGNFSDGTWKDEYLGVNATVKKGTNGVEKTENGVTFKGRGAWAEWPVGRQGENQLYHFANYNFTLLATVSVHAVPERELPPFHCWVRRWMTMRRVYSWDCRTTTRKRSGYYCAMAERTRSTAAIWGQRIQNTW